MPLGHSGERPDFTSRQTSEVFGSLTGRFPRAARLMDWSETGLPHVRVSQPGLGLRDPNDAT